ncbi:hypothetical protein, partial [Clostridium baratii]|uniref:hypothetical protein n=1 Tax=Clostridium baratii TaxID=1561 RepID=UPI00374E3686
MDYITALEVLFTLIFRNILFEDSRKKYINIIIPLSIILMFLNKYILIGMPNIAMTIIISIITIVIWILNKEKLIYVILQIITSTMIMFLDEIIALSFVTILNKFVEINTEYITIALVLLIWIST